MGPVTEPSEIERVTAAARGALEDRAATLQLSMDRISIEPILNWGGFVNRSFRVADPAPRFFLKLTADPGGQRGLERQWRFAETLATRYHAPRVVARLAPQGTNYRGILFEWIEGGPVSTLEAPIAGAIAQVINRLHADGVLAALLARDGDPIRSCAEAYLRTYHRRFVDDLASVSSARPTFVDAGRLDWMRREVDTLAALVDDSEAFRGPAAVPVHSDLWLDNILVDRAGGWYVLDWDGLGLGDPVMDWSMLFGPSRRSVEPASEARLPAQVEMDAHQRQRFALYGRAALLDWIIDPLADWVEAGREPEHGARVRSANQRVHADALAAYVRRYRDQIEPSGDA